MADDMSDENDDLDAFARLFGAAPETPPEGLRPPAESGATADPLGWLLSDSPAPAVLPGESAYAPTMAAGFPTATTVAEAPQVLPTRRSLAAEAARASREAGRRTRIILGGIGGVLLVLVVVLVAVLAAKNGSSGSPAALQNRDATPSASSTTTSTPSPTASATPTPTPTPTPVPTQAHTGSAPAPGPPTVSATVSGQPDCTSGSPTRISIAYTTTNAATLNLASSDGSVNTNLTPAASGTIPSVLYQCDGSGESYTLTAYSSSEGVPPASATVTPAPVG
jgi:hypothetical protein